jgi:hypothetical protein
MRGICNAYGYKRNAYKILVGKWLSFLPLFKTCDKTIIILPAVVTWLETRYCMLL